MITKRSKVGEIGRKTKKEETWNESVCCVIIGKNERKRAKERERKDEIFAGD